MMNQPLRAPLSQHVNGTLLQAQEEKTKDYKKTPDASHLAELVRLGFSVEKMSDLWGIQAKTIARYNDTDNLPPYWTLEAARHVKLAILKQKRFMVQVPADKLETFKSIMALGGLSFREFDF